MNRALLIGINKYPGAPLNGCINDITDMAAFLVAKRGFKMDDIRLLVDQRATTTGIRERLGWLLTGLRSGDKVLLHYSGHGAQMPTRNPQGEVDGLDEVICPVDFDWTDDHVIRDKNFYQMFLKIPIGVEFVWVSDSCHSGDLTRDIPKPHLFHKTILAPADIHWRMKTAIEKKIKTYGMNKTAAELNLALISGCKSNQTSADAKINNRYNGALTYYLMKELWAASGSTAPLSKIVPNVVSALKKNGYDQVPQLEGNPKIKAKPFLK